MTLRLVHIELKQANEFIKALHRHHGPIQGHRYSIGVARDAYLCGVIVVGRPVGGTHQQDWVEVTRCCTDGSKNACSFLYSAAARAARELGFVRIQSYILGAEHGTSLQSAGWAFDRMSHPVGWHHDGPRKARTVPDDLAGIKQLWYKHLAEDVTWSIARAHRAYKPDLFSEV